MNWKSAIQVQVGLSLYVLKRVIKWVKWQFSWTIIIVACFTSRWSVIVKKTKHTIYPCRYLLFPAVVSGLREVPEIDSTEGRMVVHACKRITPIQDAKVVGKYYSRATTWPVATERFGWDCDTIKYSETPPRISLASRHLADGPGDHRQFYTNASCRASGGFEGVFCLMNDYIHLLIECCKADKDK